METYLRLTGCQPRIPDLAFREPVDWTVRTGERWAITGDNGSGKTVLTNMIAGRFPLKTGVIDYPFLRGTDQKAWQSVQVLAFDSVFGLADFRNSYYQQRWHSTENEEMPTVGSLLEKYGESDILRVFGTDRLFDRKINFLSGGELRKFLITKALLDRPELLIVENPFIGLDAGSRETMTRLLRRLSDLEAPNVIFSLSDPNDVPEFVTHVLPVEGMSVKAGVAAEEFRGRPHPFLSETKKASHETRSAGEPVVEMNNLRIRYGDKTVLDGLDWTIRAGEKWAVSGPNGSGKSTLLSLVNADHPQGYSNDIRIFGKKRGAGQTIWEIKKNIGYVSPEMHTHYYQNISAVDVVGSGLFDTIGTVRRCDENETARSMKWMEVFGIASLRDRSFMRLSSGEQRLVLLARAFVKEPPLLILDEPLHGLDVGRKKRVLEIIDEYCTNDITLIYVTHYLNEVPARIERRLDL